MKTRTEEAAGRAVVIGLLFLLMATGAFASGSNEGFGFRSVSGSGTVKSEVRDVAGFTGVTVAGSGNAHLTPGAQFRVEVVTDDNILEYITTEVRNGVLVLSTKPGTSIRNMSRLEFNISLPSLQDATIQGSGNISIAGTVKGSKLSLSIQGSGSIDGAADVEELNSNISGSGNITVRGRADSEQIKVGGSGNVDTRDLAANDVNVTIAGSGDVWVQATEKLAANILGSGNLHYRGKAQPSVRAAGSGKVLSF